MTLHAGVPTPRPARLAGQPRGARQSGQGRNGVHAQGPAVQAALADLPAQRRAGGELLPELLLTAQRAAFC